MGNCASKQHDEVIAGVRQRTPETGQEAVEETTPASKKEELSRRRGVALDGQSAGVFIARDSRHTAWQVQQ